MLSPGMFLQERYEILEQIGSGGMSDVYKALCHKLNRLVAIKVLKAEFSSDANFVSKFKMEAQAAARLSHPNIVSVYDVIDEGTLHYIVMELIEGITLKNYIAKKGVLGINESIGIAIQVASGIAAAHEQHIIHRDIKPQNMIISKDGKVKVADFGIARAVSSQTMSSTAMGSVHYISPEQARGGYSDERSDIYALGITMYEMVTGKVPFEGDNTVTVALAHLQEPITPPSLYNPEVPISVEKIILKCTEKKSELRYRSALEVIADLRRALITPDEDFVRPAPFIDDRMARTVTISNEELSQIKEGKNSIPPAKPSYSQTPPRRPAPKRRPVTEEEDEDVNPKIEKLLTAAGVIVAVIIVAVLIFVFAQLGGLFKFGSKGKVASDSEISTQHQLKDTEVYMPDVLGLPQDLAEAKLKESNLVMKVENYDYSDQYEKGQIMDQADPEGSVVAKYSTVNVTVSQGPDSIDISAMGLVGLDVEAAKTLLETKKLTVSVVEESNDAVEKNKVLRVQPDRAKEGETVTLYISSGPAVEMTAVPDLLGKTEEIAIGMLEDAGLKPGKATLVPSDTVEKGSIVTQEFDAGTQVEKDTEIDYEVSSGTKEEVSEEEPTVPAGNGEYKYVASINENYPLKNVFGPGAATSSIQIMVRLRQQVNGKDVLTTLISARTMEGDQVLPIQFSRIEGAYGVATGQVEVVDVTNDSVLKTYNLSFVRSR